MVRTELKTVLHAFLCIILLTYFSTYFGCKLGWGGGGDSADEDDDTSFATDIERVSIATNGSQTNGDSVEPSISSDGRLIAFLSDATNLVPGDSNEERDVFVHDRDTGITERVSIASDGTEADDESITLSFSSDGLFVAFGSYATNLVDGDTNEVIDVFVRDRETGITERVSVSSDGTEANGESFSVAVSSDGSLIAFMSKATNLVPNDTNDNSDIFVHDRQTGSTERVSIDSDGAQGNGDSFFTAISSDARFVTFSSEASNLVATDINDKVDIFVRDRQDNITELITGPAEFDTGSGIIVVAPVISPDGSFVGFISNEDDLVPGDTNNSFDTFLIDRENGTIERSSVSTGGLEGNSDSSNPSISSDNRFVIFSSNANNLISNDTNGFQDVFIHDRDTNKTRRVSVAFDGSEGNNRAFAAVISNDGQIVAFTSIADNMVENDTNGLSDIFVIPNPIGQ